MRFLVALAMVTVAGILSAAPSAWPQSRPTVGDVFRQVSPSVVVIRARGREVGRAGESRFTETGSGVLISGDGKVTTAAHVVHAMDEITVEFIGGETVTATVIASEPAADLSLLQLERVPAGARALLLESMNALTPGQAYTATALRGGRVLELTGHAR